MILEYLNRRISTGDTRYCTIPTIRKNTGIERSNQYVLALTDDLEISGLIVTRQAYQMSGGRLFQITAKGMEAARRRELPEVVNSASWTGRFDLTEGQKVQIREILAELKDEISSAKLSNAKTANAMALVESVEKLIDTPDPLWPEIMRLLRSPTLSGIASIAGLIALIVQILMSAAR